MEVRGAGLAEMRTGERATATGSLLPRMERLHAKCHDVARSWCIWEFARRAGGRPCNAAGQLRVWTAPGDLATPPLHPFADAFGTHIIARRLEPNLDCS